MEIEVRIDNEVVFSGLAEDFLYAHDDIELEYTLDALETKPIGTIIEYDDMEIEKLESLLWDWMTILTEVYMEFIIENVTDEEIEILEREDFDWYPDSLDTRDVVIDGNREYVNKVLKALGRQWK